MPIVRIPSIPMYPLSLSHTVLGDAGRKLHSRSHFSVWGDDL